jgi:Flp pilus assembly pilin Flp|tara:strand:- start:915 stop:1082 length:168 start_codon:yes stop_codon:yes gene_type:complete
MRKIIHWLKDESGASAVEYALLAALSIVVFGGAYAVFSGMLLDFFTNFIDNINPF